MPKRMIVNLGYHRYACEAQDALLLLDIASRLIRVERDAYNLPFHPAGDDELLIGSAELADFEPSRPASTAHEPVEPAPVIADDTVPF